MITEFDGIAANDLYPLATTSAAKLILLNIAAKRIMHLLHIIKRQVPITYATGTTRYNLLTAASVPLSEVNRVRYLSVDYTRDAIEDNKGWFQVDDFIDIFFTVANAGIVYVDGYQSSIPIVATTAAITDVPIDLHIALVQLAIVEGCVAHEDSPEQSIRLQRLERTAMEKINRRVAKNASTAFPFINAKT